MEEENDNDEEGEVDIKKNRHDRILLSAIPGSQKPSCADEYLAQVQDGSLFERVVASEIFAEMENLRLLYEASKETECEADDEFYIKRSDVLCKLLVNIINLVGVNFVNLQWWHRACDSDYINDSSDPVEHALLCGKHPLVTLKPAAETLDHIRSLVVRYRDGEPASADVSRRLSDPHSTHSFPPDLANIIAGY